MPNRPGNLMFNAAMAVMIVVAGLTAAAVVWGVLTLFAMGPAGIGSAVGSAVRAFEAARGGGE